MRRRRGGIKIEEREARRGDNVVEAFVGTVFAESILAESIFAESTLAESILVGTIFVEMVRGGAISAGTKFTIIAAAGFFTTLFDAAIQGRWNCGGVVFIESVAVKRGGTLSRGFGGWGAEVGENGLRVNLTLAQGGEVIGDNFFFVEADLAGVGADETFVEDAAGELIEMLVLDGAEHAGADLRSGGDGVERDAATLTLLTKFFSEGAHKDSGGRFEGLGPRSDAHYHRRRRTRTPEKVGGGRYHGAE